MNEEIKKAKESLEKLIEDISIDSGYSYPALYGDIRNALDDFDKYHESQQDLIKGKDEYIAKLCNDRAELKHENEELKKQVEQLDNLCSENMQSRDYMVAISVEDLKECQKANKKLLEENHKLNQKPQFLNNDFWDKQELNDLREFAKEIANIPHLFDRLWIKDNNYKIRNGRYNENERCWLYQDVCCSTNDKVGWFLNERDGAMCFSKESAEETIERFKQWGFEGAEDLIIVLEYKEAHDRYVLFKKVVEKYGEK